jgi:hypothetical protein
MAKSAKCNIRAMHSWWAIKSYNHDVFVGCDSVMVLSKQLGVTDNQLGKALKGTGTKVSETKLSNTFPGAFEFRGYGRARCLTVLKANGVWSVARHS